MIRLALALLALSLAVSACGKKAPLRAPPPDAVEAR